MYVEYLMVCNYEEDGTPVYKCICENVTQEGLLHIIMCVGEENILKISI